MEYFYTPSINITTDSLVVEGNEFTHLTHVMRKKAGDEIIVVDGKGNAYYSTISEIGKRAAHCRIREKAHRLHEPSVDVTLAVGIVKNPSRFDILVEKTSELGVNRIVPLLTARTIPRHAKSDRWQKIALSAMKQSGRCVLPQIDQLTSFDDFLRHHTAELKIIAHAESDASLQLKQSVSAIAILIGPEGGFSEEEVSTALRHGFAPISLGKRRLRTETAAVVAVGRAIP